MTMVIEKEKKPLTVNEICVVAEQTDEFAALVTAGRGFTVTGSTVGRGAVHPGPAW